MLTRSNVMKLSLALVVSCWLAAGAAGAAEPTAKQILDATGVKGGLVVHLGCGDPSTRSASSGIASGSGPEAIQKISRELIDQFIQAYLSVN